MGLEVFGVQEVAVGTKVALATGVSGGFWVQVLLLAISAARDGGKQVKQCLKSG